MPLNPSIHRITRLSISSALFYVLLISQFAPFARASAAEPNFAPIPPDIFVQDARVVEPAAGTADMIFTISLNAPAPAGGVSVNFTTGQEPPGIGHATATADYTTTSGTVNFAVGEELKTISVPVLADATSEGDETFLVLLFSPVNGAIADGIATGTILTVNQPGTLLISELRTSGPDGAGDDFVEIYNNSDLPHTVNAPDGTAGYGLFKMGATCGGTPVLIGLILNGTVIPARGHFLFVGSFYSLRDYTVGDQAMISDIENDRNVGLFSTSSLAAISTANRFDAVGFGSNTSANCELFREGPTLTPLAGSVLEWSYQRDLCGKLANPAVFGACPANGLHKDSNSNTQDFFFADTAGTNTAAGQHLGAPGPEALTDPLLANSTIAALLLDATQSISVAPNRVRDLTPDPANHSPLGTVSFRRRFVNNTGAPVTRLRFRVIDISTIPAPAGVADFRARNSGSVVVSNINDPATCLASTGSAATPCTVNVLGTTLETPPAQPNGGGNNSTLAAGTVTLATPLAPGASINLQLLAGVHASGSFKFFLNVEALP
jgi:Calx-beta domain